MSSRGGPPPSSPRPSINERLRNITSSSSSPPLSSRSPTPGTPQQQASVPSSLENADAHTLLDQTQRDVRIYSQYFRRYELLIEFKNLKNEGHCPSGMYVMPNPDNLNEWHAVQFIHRGYYKGGVFKFILHIPHSYPDDGTPPTVQFVTDMFHPLIDSRDGIMNIRQQFPRWRSGRDWICHMLHYVRNCFKDAVLQNLEEGYCPNKEAFRMFHAERTVFTKLAAQCAQLSASDGIIYDNEGPHGEPSPSLIRFSPFDDAQVDLVRRVMLSYLSRNDGDPDMPEDEAEAEDASLAELKGISVGNNKGQYY